MQVDDIAARLLATVDGKMITIGHHGQAPEQVHRRGIMGGRGIKDGDECGVMGQKFHLQTAPPWPPYMGGDHYGKKLQNGDGHLVHRMRSHTSQPPVAPDDTKAGRVGAHE